MTTKRINIRKIKDQYYLIDKSNGVRYLLSNDCCLIKQINDIFDIIFMKEDKDYETSGNQNREQS